MKKQPSGDPAGPFRWYLGFMAAACGGALLWQAFLPELAGLYSSWGVAAGWQREIALWNVELVAAILCALLGKDLRAMKILTLQSTVLCWALGAHHLAALAAQPSPQYGIHLLGVLEVMLLGGVWGAVVLLRTRKQK